MHIYIYLHTYVYACICTRKHMRMHDTVHTLKHWYQDPQSMHKHAYTYTYTRVKTHRCTNTYTHAYIYIYHVHTRTHIHIYTYTHTKCTYKRTQSTSEMTARQRLRGKPNLPPRSSALLPVRITTARRPDHIHLSALVRSRSTQYIVHASSQLGHEPPKRGHFSAILTGLVNMEFQITMKVIGPWALLVSSRDKDWCVQIHWSYPHWSVISFFAFLDDHNHAHVMQRVAKCCSVLQPSKGLWRTNSKQYVAVCCSVLQCVAACCSVLQRAGKSLRDDGNTFENKAVSTKTSNPLTMQSLLKEFFGHCS